MTDRKQALENLLEKVEADREVSAAEMEKSALEANFGLSSAVGMIAVYRGSLDAAKAMHEAVLPGWSYCDHLRRGLRYTVYIAKSVEDESVDAVSNSPARAWLIAILKALIAKAGEA